MIQEIIKEKAFEYIDSNKDYDSERKQRLKMLVEKLLKEESK